MEPYTVVCSDEYPRPFMVHVMANSPVDAIKQAVALMCTELAEQDGGDLTDCYLHIHSVISGHHENLVDPLEHAQCYSLEEVAKKREDEDE